MADLLVTITCPDCRHAAAEQMPIDRCVIFYQCQNCGCILRPKPGDCCVYCSYGDKRCPFVQDAVKCPDAIQ
jgi:hypothetical protein